MSAARFAVFAERAGPILEEAQRLQNQEMSPDLPPDIRLRLARGKLQAADLIAVFRPVLYPEDSDD